MEEKIIYKGSPSQVTNIGYYIVCFLLLAIGIGLIMFLVRFLKTKYTKYEINDKRIIEQTGVFSRRTDETELFRVKDIRLVEPFWIRIFGLSNLYLVTSDATSSVVAIKGVPKGHELRKTLRALVEQRRETKGVKEVDFVTA